MGTGLRGCQEIDDLPGSAPSVLRDGRSAASSGWGILKMPSKDHLMLRSARKARLEARTISLLRFLSPDWTISW